MIMIMIIVKTVIKTNKYEKKKNTHTEKKRNPPAKYSRLKPKIKRQASNQPIGY